MNEVFEIGNGQACNTELHEICGTLDCMHDQKALLIGGGDMNEVTLFEPRSQDGEPRVHGDTCPTLNTMQGGQRQPCISSRGGDEVGNYIVRRLTPL